MSSSHDDGWPPAVGDSLLDRLVDGELDEETRATVLARLDTEPGGWRRYALAFLEAQAWREAVVSVHQPDALPELLPSARPSVLIDSCHHTRSRSHRSQVRRALKPAAIAAAVVVAFTAGWLASAATRPTAPAADLDPGASLVQTPSPPSMIERAPIDRGAAVASPSDRPAVSAMPVSFEHARGDLREWSDGLDVSNPQRRQLHERGYRLEHREGLMSIGLENGRTV